MPRHPPQPPPPAVSIIIPVHGQWAFTERCLASLRRHATGLIPFEIIVVDDASTDGTRSALRGECRRDPRISALHNPTNLRFAGSCNRGAAVARAPYLLFLNNDTEVTDGWLAPLLDACSGTPATGIAGARLLYPNRLVQHAGIEFSLHQFPDGVHPYPFHLGRGLAENNPRVMRDSLVSAVTGACLMIETGLFRALGGFDGTFPHYFEDIDLCLRASLRGRRTAYRASSVLFHHESASKSGAMMDELHRKGARAFLARWSGHLHKEISLARRRAGGPSIAVDGHPFSVNTGSPSSDTDAPLRLFAELAEAFPEWSLNFYGPTTFQPVHAGFFNRANVNYRSDREYFPGDADALLLPDPLLPGAASGSPFQRMRHSCAFASLFDARNRFELGADDDSSLRLRAAQMRKVHHPLLVASEGHGVALRDGMGIPADRIVVVNTGVALAEHLQPGPREAEESIPLCAYES